MSKNASNFIDRSGISINSWFIVKYLYTNNHRKPVYLCRCVCGKEINKTLCTIKLGKSKSCGCKNIENHTKHKAVGTKAYNIWKNMKSRCLNPNCDKYKWYGGRGITISKDWVNSFENFIRDMGAPPSSYHSIDRINSNGNYEANNCRWATRKEQASNRRTCVSIEGYSTAVDYCKAKGINYSNFMAKLRRQPLPSPPKTEQATS